MIPAVEQEPPAIDEQFGRFLQGFGGTEPELTRIVATRLSRAVREGHICLDLQLDALEIPDALSPDEIVRRLAASRAFGPPEAFTPVVIHGHKLFLRRYWDYEQDLAGVVLELASGNKANIRAETTQEGAIAGALLNRFTIVSGGPGTGKTTTVVQILKQLIAQSTGGARLEIALAAPTGKAAARLKEVLQQARQDPATHPAIRERLPAEAATIHRLLRPRHSSVFFRHDRRNPLAIDVLVVDEASMVALPLMSKLFAALPPKARVILLGDRDQLASVEPGAVLADMAEAAATRGSPLEGSLFVLSKNYRFGNDNVIYALSRAVRAGDVDETLALLHATQSGVLASPPLPAREALATELTSLVKEHYQPCLEATDPAVALQQLERFRVLCALRHGPYGSQAINKTIEGVLRDSSLIPDGNAFYKGMPVLVTRNDYAANLFNGDIGILMPDPAEPDDHQLWAWFRGDDDLPRRVSPARLPDHELAYAMTVHKAQGSEFESVLLVLPDRESPVVTRELVYTGLTRASRKMTLWYHEDSLRSAVARTAVRRSGLKDALLQKPAATPKARKRART